MQCQYCDKELLIGSWLTGEADFCSPLHRQRFHRCLAGAMRRIQEQSSLRPTGQGGFQGEVAVLDRPPQSVSSAPPAATALRPAHLPLFGLTTASPEMLCRRLLQTEEFDEADTPTLLDEAAPGTEPSDADSRLKRISSMLSEIREQIAKRQRESSDFLGQRARARVIPLKRAV